MMLRGICILTAIGLIGWALLIGTFIYWADRPQVWFSNASGECVKVITYNQDEAFSCDNLPTKYEKIWVR